MEIFTPHSDLLKREWFDESVDILGWILVAANLLLVGALTLSL